ncbi:hypothetical protein MKEN_00825800 [Mycena kentingensis (nom. inval.)]|nr:hypothetical protein MKEN_00825800 [Mycena kentingensis (nom. inval.)]
MPKPTTRKRNAWSLVFEKQVFTEAEMYAAFMLANRTFDPRFSKDIRKAERHKVYLANLEAHVDRLHQQILGPRQPDAMAFYGPRKANMMQISLLQMEVQRLSNQLFQRRKENERLEAMLNEDRPETFVDEGEGSKLES